MPDYAFYNVGGGGTGLRRVVGLCRRLLRRLLRPFFQRQVELFEALDARAEEVARRQERLQALVAMLRGERDATARRLAVIEDHLDALLRAGGPGAAPPPGIKRPA